MNSFSEKATKFLSVLDEVYKRQAITAILDDAALANQFAGTKTVKIPRITVDGAGDYDRELAFMEIRLSAMEEFARRYCPDRFDEETLYTRRELTECYRELERFSDAERVYGECLPFLKKRGHYVPIRLPRISICFCLLPSFTVKKGVRQAERSFCPWLRSGFSMRRISLGICRRRSKRTKQALRFGIAMP